MRPFFAFRRKSLFIPGCVLVAIILFCLPVCVYACVCNIRLFTDYESYTRPISTNLVSMEAGEYGPMHGTCSIACRLELHAVAGLLSIRDVF